MKKLIKKNKVLFNLVKNILLVITLVKVYLLKIFNIIRVDSCSGNTLRCEYNIKNKNYKYTLLGKNTPPCCLTHLYEIIRDITSILDNEDIEYFIMYGTLLGQRRHSETFIPWDTDVDLVIMNKDKNEAISVLNKELSNIYNLVEGQQILKVNFSTVNLLHADIYFWEEKDDLLIDTLNDYWIKNRIKKENVFPLAVSKLYDLNIKIPKNSIQVLKDTYGKDCLETAFQKYAFKQKEMNCFKDGKIDKYYEEKCQC